MIEAKSDSPSGTRTRAFRVKAEYPSHLDQWGAYTSLGLILTLKALLHTHILKDYIMILGRDSFGNDIRY